MPRYEVGEKVTVTTTVVDRDTNLPTDAPDITCKYIIEPYGTLTSVTPTHVSTGVYSVTLVPDLPGTLYVSWDTDGTYDVADEFVLNIKDRKARTPA